MNIAREELIYNALGKPEVKGVKRMNFKDECFLCGNRDGDIKRDEAIGGNFTNIDIARNTGSSVICEKCYAMMRHGGLINKTGKCGGLRTGSWLINNKTINYLKRGTGKWFLISRDEKINKEISIRDFIFQKNILPYCIYITTSMKKLGQLKVPINYGQFPRKIQFEEIVATIKEDDKKLFDTIQDFYSIPETESNKKQPKTYFTKEEIRSGNYKMRRIINYGIEKHREKELYLSKYRGTPKMELFVYVLTPVLDEKGESFERKTREDTRGPILCSSDADPHSLEIDELGQYKFF